MERKPHIILSSLDLERIEALLDKQPAFPGREALEAELDRADVLEPKEMPPNVGTMNSTVRFTLLESGKTNTLTLVYPKEMDGSADKVSVFAPVGIALLGLSVGDQSRMPGPSGMELLEEIREQHADTQCIILTAHGNVTTAVEAMRKGAYDFVTKPVDLAHLRLMVGRALDRFELVAENRKLHSRLEKDSPFRRLVRRSPAMQVFLRFAMQVKRRFSSMRI